MESSLRKNSTDPKKRMDIVNEIRERFKNNATYQPDQGESRKSSTETNHHVEPIYEPEEIYPIPSRQPQVFNQQFVPETKARPPKLPPKPPRSRLPDVVKTKVHQDEEQSYPVMDDEEYLMPEEIAIPQHLQQYFKSPNAPVSSATLPNLRMRGHSGSLPGSSEGGSMTGRKLSVDTFLDPALKESSSCLSTSVSSHSSCTSRPLPATPICRNMHHYPWYFNGTREEAERMVSKGQIDGTFVIRKSNHGSEKSPYSMTLYFKNKTFNLNIRALPNSKFALGKKKRNEVEFHSVREIVESYKTHKLKLMDQNGMYHGETCLKGYPECSTC